MNRTKRRRVVEVVLGVVVVVVAYQMSWLCAITAHNSKGVAGWFPIIPGVLAVGLWIAAYGLLFKGSWWRPWGRTRTH